MNRCRMKTTRSLRSRFTAVLITFAGCATVILTSGCRVEAPPQPTTVSQSTTVQPSSSDTAATKTETVTLEIFKSAEEKIAGESKTPTADYIETFDVAAGTSLEDVMRQVDQPEIVITGSGATAFVKSIDGVASNASRGWTFTIDDEFSNVGIGSVKLTPPQTVRWRYMTMEEASQ